MSKLKIFDITLNNPQGVYYEAQVVDGHVTVELNEEMKMRGIRLHFKGKAEISWTEEHSTGTGESERTETVRYYSSEKYFDHIIVVFGKGPGQQGKDPVLQKGTYTYPFHFQLPVGIPSSYESDTGTVRYSIKGVIDRPWRFDHTTRREFRVLNILDLNKEPMAMRSGQAGDQKTLCCLCCESGPISCVFKLNRLGYVPGESIPIYGEIINGSRRKMDKSFATLKMLVRYHATKKTEKVTKDLSTIYHQPILPGDSDTWNGDRLLIPADVPPSRLQGCRIIDIEYTVTLNVDPGPSFNLSVPLEVLIGSIPLRSQHGITPALPSGSDFSQPGASIPIQPSAPDLPTPSYAW